MKNSHVVLKTLLRTEKGAVLAVKNKYLFSVLNAANKIEIKKDPDSTDHDRILVIISSAEKQK